MATTRREALTAAAQEYLLAFRSHSDDAGVTPSLVAKDLDVSKQAAAEMFRRLADDRLIAPCSGHARLWKLTTSGESAADAVFRRHALLEWLLTGIVGMPWAAADLDELLGHPQTCPHGNPIDRAAEARRPKGEPLAALEAGEAATIYRVTEAAEADAALLGYLEARGLVPGAKITVLSRSTSLDSLTLDGPIGKASLGLRPAALVQVMRGAVDAALFHQIPARS
jgi:DtxR family Mn-dependent transcriptional regulator